MVNSDKEKAFYFSLENPIRYSTRLTASGLREANLAFL